jgi:anti-anti-sigma regulatory factor
MTLIKDTTTGALKISGALGIDAADSLREALLDGFLHQPEVTADLSEVNACDAAAMQVLQAGHRDAASFGKAFRITAVSPCLVETAAALGLSIDGTTVAANEGHSDAA